MLFERALSEANLWAGKNAYDKAQDEATRDESGLADSDRAAIDRMANGSALSKEQAEATYRDMKQAIDDLDPKDPQYGDKKRALEMGMQQTINMNKNAAGGALLTGAAAAPALASVLPKVGSVLASAGVNLGGAALKALGGQLMEIFQGLFGGQSSDAKQIQQQLNQQKIIRDRDLQFDVQNLLQKASAQKGSAYAEKLARALSGLAKQAARQQGL